MAFESISLKDNIQHLYYYICILRNESEDYNNPEVPSNFRSASVIIYILELFILKFSLKFYC